MHANLQPRATAHTDTPKSVQPFVFNQRGTTPSAPQVASYIRVRAVAKLTLFASIPLSKTNRIEPKDPQQNESNGV
ncbi:MAG: hypothetical protein NWS67_01635 [Schleiferiaceae bacterium]|nr:hypothetical protein [Schleiferiaceae bacterium]